MARLFNLVRPRHMKLKETASLLVLTLSLSACYSPTKQDATKQTRDETTMIIDTVQAQDIAKQAYFYGFPIVEAYKTLYAQAIDTESSDYRAPFNRIGHAKHSFTPADKAFITPNADTPYSFAWLDLRAEPVVLTLPAVEPHRYYSVQLIDVFTHNFAYVGTRTTGNGGGTYMIVGPGWTGMKPAGVDRVIRSESSIAYAIYRTQLFAATDLGRVQEIQTGYKVQTLSEFSGGVPPSKLPAVAWPAPAKGMTDSLDLFRYLNFMLQFAPTHPSEDALMTRFRKIGVGGGLPFDATRLDPEISKAMTSGIEEGKRQFSAFREAQRQAQSNRVTSADIFGSRETLKNNYLYRFAGAKLGIFGNSAAEAIYQGYYVDESGAPLDASRSRYVLRFAPEALPPANAFWSVTMYDGKSKLLVSNPIERYLINSTMLKTLQRDADGGITLYMQRDPVEAFRATNWLPAPDGPFFMVMRLYMPSDKVLSGAWQAPSLVPINR